MTDYARVSVLAQYADNASFRAGIDRHFAFDATSPTLPLVAQVSALTTGVTLDLAQFTTVSTMVIRNASATYSVHARALVVKATKTFLANKLTFADANPDTIADADSTLLTALYSVAGDRYYITGATNAGNNGTFSLQAVVAGTATLFASDTLTAAAPDAGTPTIVCLGRANVVIPAGGVVALHNVHPASDVMFTGIAGTAEVEVFAAGT